MGLDSVGPGGVPGTAEGGEHGAVGAEARGEAVLVLHGGHKVEGLVRIIEQGAGEGGDGGLGRRRAGLEHVVEDAARGGSGGGEGGAVGRGEEMEELVVLVDDGAGGGVGVEDLAEGAVSARFGDGAKRLDNTG